MAVKYCTEHTRIQLEEGKCIACGEVPYLTEEQKQMSDKTRIKWLVFVYSTFFAVLTGIIFFTSF